MSGEWLCAEPDGWNPAAALQEFTAETRAGESGRDLPHHGAPVGDKQLCFCRAQVAMETSSSTFPLFDRNLNTGEEQARGTQMVKATNVIYHDKLRPSALVVPILP